ncbi:MAG TPA: TIGR04141 family sporadically distributed protein [Albitalea sp.]|uniref:TIGR04141 family sporadically distributed protein n=1 Tax=Piscinibacter sp. TaxID=1903157 RepID=UPI002ED116D5
MKQRKQRRERLSIYLAKDGAAEDGTILKTEDALPAIVLNTSGAVVRLFVKRERPGAPPPWTALFSSRPEVPDGTFGVTRTVGAALTVRRNGRTFVLTFGSGFHLLNTESIERDFGLRVALNSVEPSKLRSVDKASYDHNPLNSRTQSTTDVDIFDLNTDSELDMLYAVTGVSRVPLFGSHVTGRDALTLMVETGLDGFASILDEAIERYTSKLPAEFEWIDNVRKVKDTETIEILDLLLNDALCDSAQSTVWLGEPEMVDWEGQLGYSFDMYANTARHVVLQLKDLIDHLEKKGRDLTVETLKATWVHVNNNDYQLVRAWSAYRCTYAEVSDGDDRFLLRSGIWYQVSADFVKTVDAYLSGLHSYAYEFPVYSYSDEGDYNAAVAKEDKAICLMDKKNTKIGGQYDKIEFCDLIRNKTDLIHVKFYRSSGTLSHLFAQGYVAAEAFIKDDDFRQELNSKLPVSVRLNDAAARPNASKYCVVYAIATSKKLPDELPFFSKVTLRNALRTLRALGYDVKLSAIDVDPALLATKKFKPH